MNGEDTVDTTTYRVIYEDTDLAGVVYYGNYLRFFERGRTEHLRSAGVSVRELGEQGVLFPVVRVEIDYRSPAAYDDLLSIESRILSMGRASVVYGQRVLRESDGKLLCEGRVTLACVDRALRPRRMPGELRSLAPPNPNHKGGTPC
jgi:acyl-CoA thioester hydrolase